MANDHLYEGERGYINVTLTYGDRWSEETSQNQPVPRTDVARAYFYMKEKESDATAFIMFTDDDPAEIEWLDEINGKVRVILGAATMGHAGNDRPWELRLKLIDGSWVTAASGKLNILPSVVGTPT